MADSVDVDAICEQFRVAMKEENADQHSVDCAVEILKEMLKVPTTKLSVTISNQNLNAVTVDKKTFIGADCGGSGEGSGLLYIMDEALYTNTTRYHLAVPQDSPATIYFFHGSSNNPLGVFAGTIDGKDVRGIGSGKWSE